MEHYILAIVSLKYARKMQVGSLAELPNTLLRKKNSNPQTDLTLQTHIPCKLVFLPCFNLPLGQNKASACQKKL